MIQLKQIQKYLIPTFTFLFLGIVYFVLPPSFNEAQRRMVVLFLLCAFLWATEFIPLYATSFVAIIGAILLLTRPGGVMLADANTYQEFLIPFASPIIMLFLGGFVISEAMRKHSLDRILTKKLLGLFGQKPFHVLTGFLFITVFLSMWMSNTATTAMMLGMVKPILANLDEKEPFRPAIVLAIAFGANIGGIGTPIGTPPNAIAIGALEAVGIHISFISWMFMAVPLVIVLSLSALLVLRFLFYPKIDRVLLPEVAPIIFGKDGQRVALIVLITIGLWLSSGWHGIPESVVSLLAVTVLVASRLVHQQDLRNIRWDILILMWGGLTLGAAMNKSGLTHLLIGMEWFTGTGWMVFMTLCLGAVGLSTVMSNTVAATLILPIAVGLQGFDPTVAGVAVALSCSLAMMLPISTPPNAMAFSTEAVSVKQMVIAGFYVSVLCLSLMLAGALFIIPAIL